MFGEYVFEYDVVEFIDLIFQFVMVYVVIVVWDEKGVVGEFVLMYDIWLQ